MIEKRERIIVVDIIVAILVPIIYKIITELSLIVIPPFKKTF